LDKLILGLLILKRLTVYEIRGIVQKYFQSMCSDSLGSIRSAVKKLLDAEMITCNEYVERSVNKKEYSITDKGRDVFLEWVHIPANLSTPKNIELAKIYNMGFLTTERRTETLNESITILENTLEKLTDIKDSINIAVGKSQIVAYWENDPDYIEGIKMATQTADISEAANKIGDFQMLCLQYEIDMTKFQIEWFSKLKNHMGDNHG